MLLKLKTNITSEELAQLHQALAVMKLHHQPIRCENGEEILIFTKPGSVIDEVAFTQLPGVSKVISPTAKYQLAASHPERKKTTISIGNHSIGPDTLTIIGGPCAIESEEQMFTTAAFVARAGAQILRGGAFKPRTSPYDFQGMGQAGLKLLRQAALKHQLLCISEVMDARDVDLVAAHVDIIQIGARNMQNFSLLKAVGECQKPIMLKRGLSATYQEFLLAAEYILSHGNSDVVLCERGIRSFETYTRNMLDITAIPVLQQLSHLPIIVDPSHGTGRRELILPMSRAAVAAGANGVMIETHPHPDLALSDSQQSISLEQFASVAAAIQHLHSALKT